MTKSKKIILLGVTGSIAAYKSCDLIRQLVKSNCDVHVIMTKNAAELVTPLTFKTLSKNHVSIDLFAEIADWRPEHISLAEKGDLMISFANRYKAGIVRTLKSTGSQRTRSNKFNFVITWIKPVK